MKEIMLSGQECLDTTIHIVLLYPMSMPRASAALRAMTMTAQCKADHDSGCEVQNDSNVRQPGLSHRPTLTGNALRSGNFQLIMRGGRSDGNLTRQNHMDAYLSTKKSVNN